MATMVAPEGTQVLQDLGVRLDDWLEPEDIAELHDALSREADTLDMVAREHHASHARALVSTMRGHLRWVMENRTFALQFELARELLKAHACAVEAAALV